MKQFIKSVILYLPFLGNYYKLRTCKFAGFTLWRYFKFTFLTYDKTIYWPRDKTSQVANPINIEVGKNTSIGNHGCYIQGNGYLKIGNYVRIGPNVGILSGNHNEYIQFDQVKKTTIIGDFTWIGMNSVIVPGVELGERTIVAAGSVVTKNFPEGYCIIGGNPAKLIKKIDKNKFEPHLNKYEFYGYIPVNKFEKFKKKHLSKKHNKIS